MSIRSQIAGLRDELRRAKRRAAAEAAGSPCDQVLEAMRQAALDGDVAAGRAWLADADFARRLDAIEAAQDAPGGPWSGAAGSRHPEPSEARVGDPAPSGGKP